MYTFIKSFNEINKSLLMIPYYYTDIKEKTSMWQLEGFNLRNKSWNKFHSMRYQFLSLFIR